MSSLPKAVTWKWTNYSSKANFLSGSYLFTVCNISLIFQAGIPDYTNFTLTSN